MTIFEEIQKERNKQDEKWGEQNHPFTFTTAGAAKMIADMARSACDEAFAEGRGNWKLILKEEVQEAFAEAAAGNVKEFREELIQTAAVVVAMIECLDRNGLK